MVQFNLLPDVKVDYMKSEKTKRLIMVSAFTLTGLAIFLVVLIFLIVNVFQKNHLSNLDADVKDKTAELRAVPDLDKVLTVQNQLDALSDLHQQKPATSRLAGYLTRITPKEAKISEVSLDYENSTLSIGGSADSLQAINKFADVIKFADYKEGDTTEKAFSEVVLSNFGVGETNADGRNTYTLQFKFDPVIFDNTKKVELVVPNIISTRSVTESPDLFEAKPQEEEEAN